MKKFFLDIIDAKNDKSSKRFVGLLSFAVMIAFGITALFGPVVPVFMFDGFMYLTMACFGLNAIIDIFKSGSREKTLTTNSQSVSDDDIEIVSKPK